MKDTSFLSQYEPTIGIECHVQLKTVSKLFSATDNDSRDKLPNSVVNEVDYGLPGMLPVLNRHAVELAIKAGIALNSRIASVSRFDRKHYFYPDLPKGYQISQLYHPIIGPGSVTVPLESGKEIMVRIHHAHLEEDAGKLTHHGTYSLVDLNRAGTPLIEIVSEPDMHSAEEAKAYAQELYLLMIYAGVTLGDLYHGNMRFDVNISVAKKGSQALGKRAEIKNLNSFRNVERVVEHEFVRQATLLESGETVAQETRGWDDSKQKTYSQRSKEDAEDYRYMPDPDIPPIVLDEKTIEEIRAQMPTMPQTYREAWVSLALDRSVVLALLGHPELSRTILSIQEEAGDAIARRVANWYASAVSSDDEGEKDNQAQVEADRLIELAKMSEQSELNSTAAKAIFNELLSGNDASPREIAKSKNLLQVSDEGEIVAVVDSVLQDPQSEQAVKDIKAGNDKAIGFLVGMVMKRSAGKANPGVAQKIIRERIGT